MLRDLLKGPCTISECFMGEARTKAKILFKITEGNYESARIPYRGSSHFTAIPQPHHPACRTVSCFKVEVSTSNKYCFFSRFKSDPERTSLDSSFYDSLILLFSSGSEGADEEA